MVSSSDAVSSDDLLSLEWCQLSADTLNKDESEEVSTGTCGS